jgi:DmsE family decaheme c-type cytochrome
MRWRAALAFAVLCLAGTAGTAHAVSDAQASEKCVECHDEEDLPDMSRSAHAVTADPRTPTCVTCHGASREHVEKKGGKRPPPDRVFSRKGGSPAAERTETCLGCHDRDAKRALWPTSEHHAADVACSSCHRIHTNHDRVLAKRDQPEVCFTCHKEQRVQLRRPSHHPIPEGKMACSDCHNVHGSMGPKLVSRDSTNDTCYTCHAEKRGPFVHEHEPVTDNCANCHNPHGSTIAAMLNARPPVLCHQCHTAHVTGNVGALGGQPGVFTPADSDLGAAITAMTGSKNVVNTWQARSCMNCHTQVHGSNNPSTTNPAPAFLGR